MEICPLSHIEPNQVAAYWQALIDANTLKYRLCKSDACMEDIRSLLTEHSYYLIDDTKVIGEFLLEHYTGKACQIHFSMHPKNKFKYSIDMGNLALNDIFNSWSVADTGEKYVNTLYGLIPKTNKPALRYANRIGFRKLGILPSGVKNHEDKVVDAYIVIRENKNGRQGK